MADPAACGLRRDRWSGEAHSARRVWCERAAVAALLIVALGVRLFGNTWDHGYLFHPDERQVVFVTADLELSWPPDWDSLFSPASSWNPGFFSYGSFPLYLLRIMANASSVVWPAMSNLRSSYVIGRVISALADVGTIALAYALGRRLYGRWTAFLAATFLTFAVLHVQLSHFYAVDTLLTCAIMLVLVLSVRLVDKPTLGRMLGAGMALGLACSIKISAAALMAPLAVAWIGALALGRRENGAQAERSGGHLGAEAVRGIIAAGWIAAITFVLLEPYALIDLVFFHDAVATESMMVSGSLDLPYTRQYARTVPYIYQIAQTIWWSLGLPLGAVGFSGAVAMIWGLIRAALKRKWSSLFPEVIPVVWFVIYFGIIGAFHAKFLRYMLPLTPLLCLWGARLLDRLVHHGGRAARAAGRGQAVVVVAASALYTLSFLHIYATVHPWEQATEWICEQVPAGSTLLIEHWDQPLPILQGMGEHRCYEDYRILTFPAYDPDTSEKRSALVEALRSADYVVIASNRLYGSVTQLPERYPTTTRYYQRLLAEDLGFELAYFAQVYPSLGPFRLVDDPFTRSGLEVPALLRDEGRKASDLVLGYVDESFTVYDHPLPMIFRRASDLPEGRLEALLEEAG